ncbi:hypothetical protein [Hymenobacter sediminicola]|uniref:DUF541 domain-containing protein n=1 Tax=Hymenobacter sediminicola TaxID=2761579 RepID=A0A7G7WA15_9BACT|nr:hypothetical protein [Hymenobacter sediminicola]QNH63208.1 hypothetical protein H4317_05210 [Hymenobacter sediminicola]
MTRTILSVLAVAVSLTGLSAFGSQSGATRTTDSRTEEYAIVSVVQAGKKNFISTTIGSKSTEEKEFESEKNAKRFDMAPVIAELEKLNAQGFELVNGSNAAMGTAGLPFYTFTMKRRIN